VNERERGGVWGGCHFRALCPHSKEAEGATSGGAPTGTDRLILQSFFLFLHPPPLSAPRSQWWPSSSSVTKSPAETLCGGTRRHTSVARSRVQSSLPGRISSVSRDRSEIENSSSPGARAISPGLSGLAERGGGDWGGAVTVRGCGKSFLSSFAFLVQENILQAVFRVSVFPLPPPDSLLRYVVTCVVHPHIPATLRVPPTASGCLTQRVPPPGPHTHIHTYRYTRTHTHT
jgi:hypothetical protein